MSILYVDTSALMRVYFADEPEHDELSRLVLDGEDPVVTSELTQGELASAATVAARTGRLSDPQIVVEGFESDCEAEGPLTLLSLDLETALSTAQRVVIQHRVRTLDAIHLAVAINDAAALAEDESVVFVTRDKTQAEAANALGMEVR